MNIFKLKFKLHHFVNMLFYVIIFILGFLFGVGYSVSMINAKAYTFGDTIPSDRYYRPFVNFYLDETQEEYNNHKYGYNNPISYSDYQTRHNFLDNHHVYDYLKQVTEYLLQNVSSDYDFLVFYHDYDDNDSPSYYASPFNSSDEIDIASAIYIYYYPKIANLTSIDLWNINSSKFFYGVGNSVSNICLAQNNCDSFIPGSGLDVVPVSYRQSYLDNNGYTRYRISWSFDELYNDYFNILDYLHFEPFYVNYNNYLNSWLNSLPGFTDNWDNSSKQYFKQIIQCALNNDYFLYPYLNESFVRPLSFFDSNMGWLIYYSSLPLTFSRTSWVNVIGSKVIYYGDEYPTYANENNISFEVLSDEDKTKNFLFDNGYKLVCGSSQSVTLMRDSNTNNSFNIYVLDKSVLTHQNEFYDFYNLDYSTNSLIKFDNSLSFIDNSVLSTYSLPNYFYGYSYFNYTFTDNYALVITKSWDYDGENSANTSYNNFWNKIISSFPNGSGTSGMSSTSSENGYGGYLIINDDKVINDDSDYSNHSEWCFYVPNDVYISHNKTTNAAHNRTGNCGVRDISFTGKIITLDGNIIDYSYQNPFCSDSGSFFSYSNYFFNENSKTFSFLSSLFTYFFNNVDSRLIYGLLTIFLIMLFYTFISYFGGKK